MTEYSYKWERGKWIVKDNGNPPHLIAWCSTEADAHKVAARLNAPIRNK